MEGVETYKNEVAHVGRLVKNRYACSREWGREIIYAGTRVA